MTRPQSSFTTDSLSLSDSLFCTCLTLYAVCLSVFHHKCDEVHDFVDPDRTAVEAGIVILVITEFEAGKVIVIGLALFIFLSDQIRICVQVVSVDLFTAFHTELLRSIDEKRFEIVAFSQNVVAAASDDDAAALVGDAVEDTLPGSENLVGNRNDPPGGVETVDEGRHVFFRPAADRLFTQTTLFCEQGYDFTVIESVAGI